MRTLHKAIIGTSAAAVISAAVLGIMPDEGLSLRPYKDIVGVWTQCYGETVGITSQSHPKTPAQCQTDLVKRVGSDYYVPLANGIPGFTTLPGPVQVAGVRLSYNVGVSAVTHSSYAKYAAAGNLRAACEAIMNFDKARTGPHGQLKVVKGLQLRRGRERAQCLEGVTH